MKNHLDKSLNKIDHSYITLWKTMNLLTPINFARPKTCAESTLSTLSNYFYLGGLKATVIRGDEVELQKGKVSCIEIVLKIVSYVLLFPITLTLLAIDLILHSKRRFTIIVSTPVQPTPLTPIPEISLQPKRELSVSKLAPNAETLEKIATVSRQWQSLAYKKWAEIDSGCSSEKIMYDLQTISKLIAECMEKPKETASIWNEVYICEDIALKEIQAIALTHNSPYQLWIAHMATHPQNVRSAVNKEETTRVEGSASAIINHLMNTLPSSCREIYLESVSSAVKFYKKFGFEVLDLPPFEWGCIPMGLSAKKIQSMISLKPQPV